MSYSLVIVATLYDNFEMSYSQNNFHILTLCQGQWSNYGGPREGLAHLKDLAPYDTSVLRGVKGAYKRHPKINCKMITHYF